MSDYIRKDDDIDSILEQIKAAREKQKEEAAEPSKAWSAEDIDRLIAQTNGEEYIPEKKEASTPAADFERILSREFDTGMFTIKPITEEKKPEMQDISSGETDSEVEGQETLYEDEPEETFDDSVFEIETVILPDAVTEENPLDKYNREPEKAEAAEAEIKIFDDAAQTVREIFRKQTEEPLNPDDGSHIDENQYRTRFFRKMTVDDTGDIDVDETGPIDKSGILIEKGTAPAEEDLEPMPKVLAAENAKAIDEEKTRIRGAQSAQSPADEKVSNDVEGQMMLTGFEDIPEETLPESTDETAVEESLGERRRRKAKAFRLTGDIDLNSDFEDDFKAPPEEVEKEEKARKKAERRHAFEEKIENEAVGNEYDNPDERAELHTLLTQRASKAVKELVTAGVIEAILVVVNLMPSLTDKLSIESVLFAKGSEAFYVMNIVLLAASVLIFRKKFFGGFSDMAGGRINGNSVVSLSVSAALLQSIIAAVFANGEQIQIFAVTAGLTLLISKAADLLDAERILGNFEVCAFKYEHNMYAVHPLENEAEIFELGRGLMMGDAELIYSSKLAFPTDFIRNSISGNGENKLVKAMLPVAAAAAAVAAVLAGIFTKSVMTALSAFAGIFCICAPALASFIPSFILSFSNYGLNKAGTMVVSLDEAAKLRAANAVVMDSADIFSRSECTMHGMKNFDNVRIDDVLLYAAALVIKSGGPLRECFEQVVDGRQDILPPVKELNYEDKLGISARIHNQKVLLGNRNMLIHHNIDVPEKTLEEKYAHSGRKVIYLAVAEKIAAMFVVSYAVDMSLEPYLRILEGNGIQVLIRTNDVNVTEELISESFGLPQENFRVLSSVAGKLFKRRRDAVCDKLPAGTVHDGTAYSMLRAVASGCNMEAKAKFGNVLQIIFSVLGFILGGALFCTGSGEIFTGITTFVFIAVSLAVSSGLTFLGRTK